MLSVKYLRHGSVITGGTHFERHFVQVLQNNLNDNYSSINFLEESNSAIFQNWNNLKLLIWAFKKSNADVNIVVGRLGLSSIIRNLFNENKTIIVLHNYDSNDGKSAFLKLYFNVLFYCLKKFPSKRNAIICVSNYFKDYFENEENLKRVFIYPNSFDASFYSEYVNKDRSYSKKIWMGQISSKYDTKRLDLADILISKGFIPIFCRLKNQDIPQGFKYQIFEGDFDSYLKEMASCYCSLSLSKFIEGWPRMVHESILVGTPVIGYPIGGLKELLLESNSIASNDIHDVINHILTNQSLSNYSTPISFKEKYDHKKVESTYLPNILHFIKR